VKGYGISFGALSDDIEDQLLRQGFTLGDKAQKTQRCADYISYLRIHSMLTETESDRARQRLMKEIKRDVRSIPTTPPETP
jgi:hypothetical protein